MNISGLESNFYLVDNPVYLTASGILTSSIYIEYYLTVYNPNGSIKETSQPQRIYNLNTSVSLDIAPLLKSFMPEPAHNTEYTNLTDFAFYNNSFKGKVTVKEYAYAYYSEGSGEIGTLTRELVVKDTKEATKFFIRGGKRTYDSNQHLSTGNNLIVTNKIPVWGGYPSDLYYTDATDGIKKSNVIPGSLKEERIVKGCDPKYVKFMNSLGGYSYWLFENWETKDRNSNLGDILRRQDILDLGNESEESLTLISKVPNRFINLMKDLIVSKEIYVYDQSVQTWTRLSSDSNDVKENPYDVNTKVKLNFKTYSRYNPSLLW